jgi:hypothetical protein
VRYPSPSFRHLRHLTDEGGLYEHAQGTIARREHGYCLDDVARALVVVSRDTGDTGDAGSPGGAEPGENQDLCRQYLRFVLDAQADDGRFGNRRGADLGWRGRPCVEDCWGRGLWGLGAAVSGQGSSRHTDLALSAFGRGAAWRSPHSRAMAFAALGAAEVLRVAPGHRGARELIGAAALLIGRAADSQVWPWPEPRLTYANAALPEAMLAAGAALENPSLVANGLRLLGWLLDIQTLHGHLSVVPVGGRGVADPPPGFDQQPIEAAALADACARAYALTGEQRWAEGIDLAASWFLGNNDVGVSLFDPDSGGGCDGLERDGRNENQGAESTLALISTMQQARRLSLCHR